MTNQHTQLIEGLRTWASGYSADRAAVELLITHDEWLTRADFQQYMESLLDHTGQPLTVIDWEHLREAVDRNELIASSSAVQVLRIALSLAVGLPVDLGEAMTGLDATNTTAVALALVTTAQAEDRVNITHTEPRLSDWFKETR